MNDTQLTRYGRHILLPEIDLSGQEKLLISRVLIVGLGGLGTPAALYLAGSGVGTLVINDYDRVDLSNLQRQIIYTSHDVGQGKVCAAAAALLTRNPDTQIIGIDKALTEPELREQVRLADVVVDASDNFPTRFNINRACIAEKTPLISGSAIRLSGHVTVFRSDLPSSPCYNCLYPHGDDNQETCAEIGVLAPLAGIIGCIQAVETIKILAGFGESLLGRLLQLDALTLRWRETRLIKDPKCPICANNAHPTPRP